MHGTPSRNGCPLEKLNDARCHVALKPCLSRPGSVFRGVRVKGGLVLLKGIGSACLRGRESVLASGEWWGCSWGSSIRRGPSGGDSPSSPPPSPAVAPRPVPFHSFQNSPANLCRSFLSEFSSPHASCPCLIQITSLLLSYAASIVRGSHLSFQNPYQDCQAAQPARMASLHPGSLHQCKMWHPVANFPITCRHFQPAIKAGMGMALR